MSTPLSRHLDALRKATLSSQSGGALVQPDVKKPIKKSTPKRAKK